MLTIKLDYDKARKKGLLVDYKKYMEENTVVCKSITVFQEDVQQPMKLLNGSPLIVCVEGTYVKADSLPEIAINGNFQLERYLTSLHNTTIKPPFITFKWRR